MRSPKCQLQPTDCSRKQEAPATPPQHMSQNSTHDNWHSNTASSLPLAQIFHLKRPRPNPWWFRLSHFVIPVCFFFLSVPLPPSTVWIQSLFCKWPMRLFKCRGLIAWGRLPGEMNQRIWWPVATYHKQCTNACRWWDPHPKIKKIKNGTVGFH